MATHSSIIVTPLSSERLISISTYIFLLLSEIIFCSITINISCKSSLLVINSMEDASASGSISEEIDIYFVPYQRQDIYKFDTNTLSLSLALSSTNFLIGYGPHLCALGKGKLFMQGGVINDEFISDSVLIDITTGEITEKAFGPINAGGACVHYENFIFIFGGATRGIYEPSSLSQKYDIENDQWSILPPLPLASYNNSGTIYGKKIAIVGQHLGNLYFYDIDNDNYIVDRELLASYKIITAHNEVIFIIFENGILVLEDGKWSNYPQDQCRAACMYSYQVFRDNYIYFVVPPQVVIRLDIRSKVIEQVATNSI